MKLIGYYEYLYQRIAMKDNIRTAFNTVVGLRLACTLAIVIVAEFGIK